MNQRQTRTKAKSPVVMTGFGVCNPRRLAAGKKRTRMGGGSGV